MSETKDTQQLAAKIVELLMANKAPPKRAVLALLSVLLPTLHQEGFDKERALGVVGRYWDGVIASFSEFQKERDHIN